MIIVAIMMLFVLALSIGSLIVNNEYFATYWYLGYSKNPNEPWPYLNNLEPPQWEENTNNLLQNMFLFTTLLNNFVPLSLYVTMEVVTRVLMVYINTDLVSSCAKLWSSYRPLSLHLFLASFLNQYVCMAPSAMQNMYHEETDTPANARSTTVTDLGQIKFIFSDKTGTLTQNVMRYKRCSVDGILFGAPVVKSTPSPTHSRKNGDGVGEFDEVVPVKSFHPLRKLLVGAGIPKPKHPSDAGLASSHARRKFLTYNTEMFLRVMSICHTVVVEKDYDAPVDEGITNSNDLSSWLSLGLGSATQRSFGGKKRKTESLNDDKAKEGKNASRSGISECLSSDMTVEGKSKDGAPLGQSYQAESPDEGALVSAASIFYGFQLLGRSSSELSVSLVSLTLM